MLYESQPVTNCGHDIENWIYKISYKHFHDILTTMIESCVIGYLLGSDLELDVHLERDWLVVGTHIVQSISQLHFAHNFTEKFSQHDRTVVSPPDIATTHFTWIHILSNCSTGTKEQKTKWWRPFRGNKSQLIDVLKLFDLRSNTNTKKIKQLSICQI